MPFLNALGFAQPWLLLALIGLPALWLLLRVTPPAPRSVRFPAIRLLTGLTPPEETPARTPLWLLLLRLLAAALIIVGLAGPVLYPAERLSGSGPLVLVVDDGWAAAKDWPAREQAADALLDRAERDRRRVVLVTTAQPRANVPLTASDLLTPPAARERVAAIEPKPWRKDLEAARGVAEGLALDGSAHVVWLHDGLAAPGTNALAEALQHLGRLDVLRPAPGDAAKLVLPPDSAGTRLDVPVLRASAAGEATVNVLALAEDGRLVGTAEAAFIADATRATASFELPLELRNRMARVAIGDEGHAGAVALLDGRWRRRPVGLVSESAMESAQPLLSELHYLDRALAPYAEVTRGSLDALMQDELAVITLPDRGALPAGQHARVSGWVEDGGVLLRFAGPKLARGLTGPEAAQAAEDGNAPLLPVRLRRGGRALGGTMSWDSPAALAPFPQSGPFAGLTPPGDVTVSRQVLAEPSLELGEKTWARLADGTPLVTAERRGDGWVVLVHTTANTDWSNLPLSGLFVQMLRRVVALSEGVTGAGGEGEASLPPHQVLDGFGRLREPPAGVQALPAKALAENAIGPAHPPGTYGSEGGRRAHNLGPAVAAGLAPLAGLPSGVAVDDFAMQPETRLGPWLLAAALLLLVADLIIALALRGLLPAPTRAGRTGTASAVLLALALATAPETARAQSADDEFALKATLQTRLAYIETGVPTVDDTARQGLQGLTDVLTRRTAVEPGPPLGVDPRRDELAFFPLLYWPITPRQADLSALAVRRVNDYLRNGGTILFDLRETDGSSNLFGRASPGSQALQRLTRRIEMPPLQPVDPEHVLTKAFYLLQDFPGRYAGGTLWVEDTTQAAGDGVASVIVGSNDWAGAWAVDDSGSPQFAVVPGGERQREMARRVGVNIVMYALTGNYKADQVHVPAILERLGQ